MLLLVLLNKLHRLIHRIHDIAIRWHSRYLNILNLSWCEILTKLLQTLPPGVTKLNKAFALLFILIVDGLEMFVLARIFGFDDLYEFPFHLVTVFIDDLLRVGSELLDTLLVGWWVEVTYVSILVPTQFPTQFAEVLQSRWGLHIYFWFMWYK